ncbi:kinesin-like protein KIF15 [Antedon mediterranea]|uniref:kinesin-like protein KIF15 n=1 Tax=Antedon mediterranea TaxID=105859 RepID=UPI003AF74C95
MKVDSGEDAKSDGDSIKVFLRIRPPSENDLNLGKCLEVCPPDTVCVQAVKPEKKAYRFDHVADENTTQEFVFNAVGRKTVESCIAGYNGTIFAYGQTGSGKTFTMMGPSEEENFEHPLRGVVPRSIDYLFSLIEREREKRGDQFEFSCKCSFLEIYKEQVFDLLDHASNCLQLRENVKHGVYADGLIENLVSSPHDAYQVLCRGWLNRRVAATSMNRESSRSHAVFTVSIETKEKQGNVSNLRVSHLHMVDLAGSERQKDTQAVGTRIKEAGSINSSLSVLGRVITALVDIGQGKNRYVPYRESKLSFLLRDALGGNTKTFIIANVHPGSRQIGETISTLNFARRAKMIKNRAVINQDTQGSVVQLHAEIKRLKDKLSQYSSGVIPTNPVDNTEIGPVSSKGCDTNKWQTCFFEAMLLWEKSDMANKTLTRKISQLQNLCKKKDNFLMSNKMVIKLRESALSRFQEAQKEKLTLDDRDNRIEDLQKEIGHLKKQLEHNPTVAKFAMENSHLRSELKALQASGAVLSIKEETLKHKERLQKQFQELTSEIDELKKTGNTPSSATQGREGNTAVATVERFRSQIDKLTTQLIAAKQELSEQVELHKHKQVELESQVAAERKTNKELQHALNAIKLTSKMERDEINDLHLQTIKTITTPKKASYHLRSRLIMQAKDNTPGVPEFNLEEDGGILGEKMPDHMVEQCNEALTDEVKKLQNKNNELLQLLEKTDTECFNLKQTVSQTEQLNQRLEQGRIQLTNQISSLTTQLETVTNQFEVIKYESEDFKVLLPLAYKELDEKKKECVRIEHQAAEDMDLLQVKVCQVDHTMMAKQRELDEVYEQLDRLQDDNVALQAEVSVNEQQTDNLQAQLNEKTGQNLQLESEVQSLLEKLELEMQKSGMLMREIQSEASEQQKQLVEELEELQETANHRNKVCQSQQEQLQKAREELCTAQSTITTMQKRSDEDKEAVSNLMTTVQELRAGKQRSDSDLASLESTIQDLKTQSDELKTVEEQQTSNLHKLEENMIKKEEEIQSQNAAHNMELEMLKEDLDEALMQADSLREALSKQTQLAVLEQEEQKKKHEEVIRKKDTELSETVTMYENKLRKMESQQKSTVSATSEVQAQADQLQTCIDEQAAELVVLRDSQTKARELIEQFECSREEKNKEIDSLKVELKEIESLKIKNEEYENKCHQLQMELDETNERLMEIRHLSEELRSQADRANYGFDSSNKIKDEVIEEKFGLLKEIAEMKEVLNEVEESKKQIAGELERTRALECTAFEKKGQLESKLEEIMEEKSRLEQDVEKTRKSNEALRTENTKLVGHQNLKQKIQHHIQIKKENNHLREEVARLNAELLKQDLLDGFKRKRHCSRREEPESHSA